MSSPTFYADRGRYLAEWMDPVTTILLDRLRDGRDGDTTAEISIDAPLAGHEVLRHVARINLTSTRSRAEVAKHLTTRDPLADRRDWHHRIETACTLALTAYRKGTPARYLRDIPEPDPDDLGYALSPFALARMPTFLFGDGGGGKSLVALAAAQAIATGEPFAGMVPDRPRKVALLDWEMDGAEHRRRLARLSGGAMPDVLYVPCARPLADDLDRLRDVIEDHSIEYVILDSVALACDGPPEAAEVATRFFGALRRLEVGALCVAHVNRSQDADRPFGSTFWHNGARLTWYAKRERDPSPDSLTVGLFAKKANTGAMPAPIGLRFTFTGDTIDVSRTDVSDVADFTAHIPLRVRIAAELRTGSRTIAELSERLEVSGDSVKKALQRGEGTSFVRLEGTDRVFRWGLAA